MSYFYFYAGLSFWKCGSRKIFAVANSENVRVPQKRTRSAKSKATLLNQASSDISDDSDDDFVPRKLNKKSEAAEQHQTFHQIKGDIQDVKCMVTEMLEVNKSLPLPLGITKLVKDAFKCKICYDTPMKPPIIATRCCSSLLGCEECVNQWYDGVHGLSKKCPHCGEARGYASTFQFKGLDDFLTGMGKALRSEEDTDNQLE